MVYKMAKTKKAARSLSVIVGKNIRTHRVRKGLTQNQLAQELGLEFETVSRYERGLVAPSFSQIENICAVFDITAWMLFLDDEGMSDVRGELLSALMKGLSKRDSDFIQSIVQAFAEHQQSPKK